MATSLQKVKWNGGRQGVSGIVATVFGGYGFLGRYIIEKLGFMGSQIIVPYRGDGQSVRHIKPMGDLGQIVPLPFDITDDESIRRTVVRSNVIINLLGNQFETPNYSHFDTHVKLVHRIAKIAAESSPAQRFIHFSALGADSKSPSTFFKSKAEGEEVIKYFFPDAVIFRPAHIYGLEDTFLNRICKLVNNSPIVPLVNGGLNKVQPIHAWDVTQAVINSLVVQEAPGNIYHLGGPQVLTYKDVVELVEQQLMTKSNVVYLPHQLAKLYGSIFDYLPARFRLLTKDLVVQQMLDVVVPADYGTLTSSDLGVNPGPLSVLAGEVFTMHRGEREPAPAQTTLTSAKRHALYKFDASQ